MKCRPTNRKMQGRIPSNQINNQFLSSMFPLIFWPVFHYSTYIILPISYLQVRARVCHDTTVPSKYATDEPETIMTCRTNGRKVGFLSMIANFLLLTKRTRIKDLMLPSPDLGSLGSREDSLELFQQ